MKDLKYQFQLDTETEINAREYLLKKLPSLINSIKREMHTKMDKNNEIYLLQKLLYKEKAISILDKLSLEFKEEIESMKNQGVEL